MRFIKTIQAFVLLALLSFGVGAQHPAFTSSTIGNNQGNNYVTFAAASLDPFNAYVDLNLNDAVFHSTGGPVLASDFQIVFYANGGTATDCDISSLTKIDGTALAGGEADIRINISITGSASGVERIEIKASAFASIISNTGKVISSGESTGFINLNVSYDSDYLAVLQHAIDNGISIPSYEQRAIDSKYIGQLKTANAWTEFDFFYPFFNNVYTDFSLIDFRNPTTRSATFSGTVLKTFYEGYRSNGSSYINLNYVPSTDGVKYTQNDASVWVYISTNARANAIWSIGARGTAGDVDEGNNNFQPQNNSDLAIYSINRNTATGSTVTNTSSKGLYVISREISTTNRIYKAGSEIGNNTGASSILTNKSMYACAVNNNGTAASFDNIRDIGFVAAGSGMQDVVGTASTIIENWINETKTIVPPETPSVGPGANHLIIITGQSNADGRGDEVDLPGEMRVPIQYCNVWYGGGWQQLDAGVNANNAAPATKVGFMVPLAYELHQLYPDDNFYFVNQGVGGSSLSSSWDPVSGTIYSNCEAAVADAIAALDGISFTSKRMIWYQGETDSYYDVESSAYEVNEQDFITAAETDFSLTHDVIVCNISTTNPYNNVVRQAKINNAAASYYVLKETSDLNPTNMIHLTTSMFITLADRILAEF